MHLVVQFICLYPTNIFKIYSISQLMCFVRYKMKKKNESLCVFIVYCEVTCKVQVLRHLKSRAAYKYLVLICCIFCAMTYSNTVLSCLYYGSMILFLLVKVIVYHKQFILF